MTYWEALDILEHGSSDFGKRIEASAIAREALKEIVRKLDEAEDAEFREAIKDGPIE